MSVFNEDVKRDMAYLCTWINQDRRRVNDGVSEHSYHAQLAVDAVNRLKQAGISLEYNLRSTGVPLYGRAGLETPLNHALGWQNSRLLVMDCNATPSVPGSLAVVQAILDTKVDLGQKSPGEPTALWNACIPFGASWGDKEQIKIVDALLKAGSDPNVQVGKGLYTPLSVAIDRSAKVVEILLQAGADPRMKDGRGESILDLTMVFHRESLPVNREVRKVFAKSGYLEFIPDKTAGNRPPLERYRIIEGP